MNNGIIPLDIWLGSYKDRTNKASGKTERSFVSSECFRVESMGILNTSPQKDYEFNVHNFLIGSELVLGINNKLNTDVPCWPEGLAQDFSNLVVSFDEKKDDYVFGIVLNIGDIEDIEFVTVDGPEGHKPYDQVIYFISPRFESFINNEKPTFLNLLTMQIEDSMALAVGNALVGSINEEAPQFRVMKVNLEKHPEFAFLESPVTLPDQCRIGIIRYINKIAGDLIHEDMVEKLNHVRIQKNPDEAFEILTSWNIFGQLYLITAIFVHDYELPEEEHENETI